MPTENVTQTPSQSQALAPITTGEQFSQALARWTSQYHVLSPFTAFSYLPHGFGLVASQVTINVDRQAGEVHGAREGGARDGLPFLKGDEVALAKNGLRKIAECAGISTTTTRMDPRTIPHYWEVQATAHYRGLDGAWVTRQASCEWDLRDGSPRLKGFQPAQIEEARKHGLRNCETRALNAVIRECGCGVKQKYTKSELAKPFLVLRMMFQPDMSDPATRRLVTEQALSGAAALYPAQPAALSAPLVDVPPHEPEEDAARTVGFGQSDGVIDVPKKPVWPDGFGLIQRLTPEKLKKRSDPTQTFTKWRAVDHEGVEHVTVKPAIGARLEECYAAKRPVSIDSEENGYSENEITGVHTLPAEDEGY